MKNLKLSLIIVILAALISGCGTMGNFRANNITNVELSEPNFNIVARGVEGSSMQGYLFGFSVPQGSDIATIGLIKVSGDERLYDAAVKRLWENYRDEFGKIEGKKLALINIRQDTEMLNTFVYTEAKIFITADVVEFIE